MRHLDLFSGIGGFALAAQWVWGEEHEVVSFVEIDPFCQKVLKKHWPHVPIISDIRDVDETILANTKPKRHKKRMQPEAVGNRSGQTQSGGAKTVDLLTGGFPCQPFSVAGKQRSKEDDRYLWPEMLRVIREVRPTWIVGENVAGIINLALDIVLLDLEDSGYKVQSFLIPACGVDAPHRRDRVWIIGHSKHIGWDATEINGSPTQGSNGVPKREEQASKSEGSSRKLTLMADTTKSRLEGTPRSSVQGRTNRPAGSGLDADTTGTGVEDLRKREEQTANWIPEPDVCGMVDGVSPKLDSVGGLNDSQGQFVSEWPNVPRVSKNIPNRVDRLKSLGNAIVPQVVVPIMQAIKDINELQQHKS